VLTADIADIAMQLILGAARHQKYTR